MFRCSVDYKPKYAVKVLQNIVSRRGSGRILTFSSPHVYKALQLLSAERYVSRATFGQEIHLGGGAVKTLISYLRDANIIQSTRSGSYLTPHGKVIISAVRRILPKECTIEKCTLAPENYNHAIIIKRYADEIRLGIEQRDYAVKYGATSCSTLLYIESKFVFPNETKDCFDTDVSTRNHMISKLSPKESDIVIVASAADPFVAEIAAKNSALSTISKG